MPSLGFNGNNLTKKKAQALVSAENSLGVLRSSEFGTHEAFYRRHSERSVDPCSDALGSGTHSCTN